MKLKFIYYPEPKSVNEDWRGFVNGDSKRHESRIWRDSER
jgi:hypothetical protein